VNPSFSTQQKHGVNLITRLALSFVALATISSAITLTVVFLNFRQQLRTSLRQRLLDIVTLASLQQDGDAFSTIQSANDPEYERVHLQNTKILMADSDLVFVYTMRFDAEGLYFVVDAGDPTSSGFSPYGTRYYEPGPVLSSNYETIQQPISEASFYADEYGRFLSAYAPIRDRAGQVVGIIGADISANKILAGERQLLVTTLGIFAATLPFIAILGWLLGKNLATPIRSLTAAASRIAQGELNYRPAIKTVVPEITLLNQSFFSMADQQKALIENLEERVTVRTSELRAASEQVQRRAAQLQTVSEVAHAISLVQDLDKLLLSIANLISERFSFYHVGIFLLDSNNDYAVLSATNSEGGRRMLERGHRLKVGEVGIVGYVAGWGKPRIVLDVGADAVFFNNPDLPETRSEMALPLLVRERVIGVLDIQSKETAAFKEEDFEVFHTLADQVAIAIENARLFSETRRALEETGKAYGEFIRKGWSDLAQTRQKYGVRLTPQGTQNLSEYINYPEIKRAIKTVTTVTESKKNSSLTIPLTIRGEPIGVLHIRIPEARAWNDDEINTIQRIAERAALALENARLVEDASQRAIKERTISEVSARISASINIRNVLQTAVEELGHALPGSDVEIRLKEQ
jgi:GAF domain-containing protein/HAMP domain-containing protein